MKTQAGRKDRLDAATLAYRVAFPRTLVDELDKSTETNARLKAAIELLSSLRGALAGRRP
jgi:hypothetical protein